MQPFDVAPGDVVHTCVEIDFRATLEQSDRWGPCYVLQRDGETLLVRDATGRVFEVNMEMTAVLPKGYEMKGRKLRKIVVEPPPVDLASEPVKGNEVHVVRTDDWRDAGDDPITMSHVDEVIGNDPELTWSADDRIAAAPVGGGIQSLGIRWQGEAAFWWRRHEIVCVSPTPEQLAKLIDIAIILDANVVGDDGEVYH